MPEILDTSRFALPADALIGSLEVDINAAARSQPLEKIKKNLRKGSEDQNEWARAFDELYEEARKSDFSAPFLMRWSAAVLERQRAALVRLYPLLEEIQRQLAALRQADPELLQLYKEMIDFIFGWIAPYQKLSGQLLELASARRSANAEILRAKPIEGEVDHEALTREFMARFPKLRAALAK